MVNFRSKEYRYKSKKSVTYYECMFVVFVVLNLSAKKESRRQRRSHRYSIHFIYFLWTFAQKLPIYNKSIPEIGLMIIKKTKRFIFLNQWIWANKENFFEWMFIIRKRINYLNAQALLFGKAIWQWWQYIYLR